MPVSCHLRSGTPHCSSLFRSLHHRFVCQCLCNERDEIRDGGKHFSARAILSTIAGESCDSLIFFPLALGGVVPASELPWLMLWQVILKTAYEIVVLPLTIRVVKYVKKHEGEDVYDNNISYNVFKIFSLG